MTKQEKVISSLKEKIGEKMFTRTSMIATERFGDKQGLKIKDQRSKGWYSLYTLDAN